MISIVVCCVNPTLLRQLISNVEQTVGVPFEILSFDNRKENKGLCAVYNQHGRQAKYPILCFVHEDVSFETKDWGEKVIHHLLSKDTGLISVAGGDAKSSVPTSWSTVLRSKEMNVLQSDKHRSAPTHIRLSAGNVTDDSTEAVCLDGLFLCTRKDVFDEFQFDEERLKGFHGYDIDYSLQVFTKYKVKVVFDILMTHYSSGNVNKAWMESAMIIAKKWKHRLPLSVYQWTDKERDLYHWKSMQVFVQNLFILQYPYFEIVLHYLRYSFSHGFSLRRFLSMGMYMVNCMLHKNLSAEREDKSFPQNSQLSIKTDV